MMTAMESMESPQEGRLSTESEKSHCNAHITYMFSVLLDLHAHITYMFSV